MRFWRALLLECSCGALLFAFCSASSAANDSDVPTVDAAIGSCRADFTVKDDAGKPIYNAKIDTKFKYGHFHRAELEAATNSDGKARFTGLPEVSKKPLEFVITSGSASRTITLDPFDNCNATFTVTLPAH